MSKSAPESPDAITQSGVVSIVASRYNATYTDALVESATAAIQEKAPGLTINLIRVPGAFEIPVIVESCASQEDPPLAIIALGVIIRGSTAHADLIAQSITDALQTTAISHLLPVIHEVLLVDDAEQAETRALGDELNRGREAGEAAISMIEVFDEMNRAGSSAPS